MDNNQYSTKNLKNSDEIVSNRLLSIDVLRGFDMFWIRGGEVLFITIFHLIGSSSANFLADQLEHSAWDGFTFYDLIFPLFIFLSGISIPFSLAKRKEMGDSKSTIYVHIFKRTTLLYILGLIVNGIYNLDFQNARYLGVLQRIAICYFISSIIVMNVRVKYQTFFMFFFITLYYIIMLYIPVPGFGQGILTPEGNLSGFIDRLLLPGSFCCYEYGDSEGILSTIPAISTCLLGVLSGQWLRKDNTDMKKLQGLLLAGIGCIILGLLWSIVFPINKYLWTSSFVMLAGGLSILLLSFFYWTLDIKKWRKWAFPFKVIGSNSIFIYIVGNLIYFRFLTDIFNLAPLFDLIWIIFELIVRFLLLYIMYKKKIFIKV